MLCCPSQRRVRYSQKLQPEHTCNDRVPRSFLIVKAVVGVQALKATRTWPVVLTLAKTESDEPETPVNNDETGDSDDTSSTGIMLDRLSSSVIGVTLVSSSILVNILSLERDTEKRRFMVAK
jgi:hypothetical protein